MLDGTTTFVTGASGGIGREIAITLAEKGANVALAARSDGIYETAAGIDDDRCVAVETDVTDEDDVAAGIAATVEAFGGLDCLVNNAGIAGPTAPIEAIEREEWERTLAVNLTGPYLTTKHAVDHLRDSENPSIVNISSISGKRPLVNRTPYTASKMALLGLTRTLAFELDDYIRVNSICPGAVAGDRLDRIVRNHAEEIDVSFETAWEEIVTDDLALSEIVDPEDVAEMTAFLASENGRHITAQDINVDSGAAWY